MSEIILCNQQIGFDCLEAAYGIRGEALESMFCQKPKTLSAYTPYIVSNGDSSASHDLLRQLTSIPVAKELTNLSLSFGSYTTIALSEMTKKLVDYNLGVMGASTSVYATRIGGFAGAVKNYQDALMNYRSVVSGGAAAKSLAKQKVISAFEKMQKYFRHELNTVTAAVKARRGTPLTSSERALNIARSSRNVVKLNIANQIQANNLVKFTKHAKFMGNGLAVIDFASRAGNVHNTYKEGGNWERDLFIESSSFAASAAAGVLAVKAGTAALGFLVMATPIGWVGLIVGGVAVAGVAAATSIGVNSAIKENSGSWYDAIMSFLEIK